MEDYYAKTLLTQLQTRHPDAVTEKREQRIKEAINFEKGENLQKQKKHSITHLDSGNEVYFLKPGKEASRKRKPRPNDMVPKVDDLFNGWAFDRILVVLLKFSFVDFKMFKIILVLLYRSAFLLDHIENEDGKIRYKMESKIKKVVRAIDKKFYPENKFHLMDFLYFIDLLGWNEDVKYFKNKNWNSGRINTLLTFIRIPYFYNSFFNNNISKPLKDYNWQKFFDSSQSLMRGRGVSPATQTQLVKWFPEYIKRNKKQTEIT